MRRFLARVAATCANRRSSSVGRHCGRCNIGGGSQIRWPFDTGGSIQCPCGRAISLDPTTKFDLPHWRAPEVVVLLVVDDYYFG
eukprot:scaffold36935_cov24-Attheya_sp.AAC.1